MHKSSLFLQGLNCPNCAAKIEERIKKITGVQSVQINFATQKLNIVSGENCNDGLLLKQIVKIVKAIEPNVEVVNLASKITSENDDEKNSNLKGDLIILFSAGILFILALFINTPYWLKIAMFIASYLVSGFQVLYVALKNVSRGKFFDENFLMTVATLGALFLLEFPEATAVMLFYKIGQILEGVAVNNSRKSIHALIKIRPDYANLKSENNIFKVNPSEVKIGDIILVKPGERVPLDGIILEGSSMLDTSAITGESVPRSANPGANILSGSINLNATLTVTVTNKFEDSTVSKILNLVQDAASNKAPAEKFITKFARYYTPAVVAAAAIIAIIPPIISGSMSFDMWISRALIFLVISCPCALVISIPLSFFGGIGGASRRGILIKGSNYLEALSKVNIIVFDKTGTLTKGVFKVTQIFTQNGYTESQLLELAAKAEVHSNHPIARSITEAYSSKVDLQTIPPITEMSAKSDSYEDIPGCGIKALIDGRLILAGNDRLMHSFGDIKHDTCEVQGTVIHIAVDNIYAGYLLISDEIKEDSKQAIAQIKQLGDIRIVMLTGDSEQSAKNVADELKIEEYYSGLLPHQKVEKMQTLKSVTSKAKVAFVGDGINDAPVLAMADIGVSMGGLGSDAAIEASDIVLMTDEPSRLLDALMISRKTKSIVWQNITFAFVVKLLVMILGAGGLATMWEAVFADVGVTLLAILNSLRVMKKVL